MDPMATKFWNVLQLTLFGIAAGAAAGLVTFLIIGFPGENRWVAPMPVVLGSEGQETFIADRAEEDGFSEMSEEEQSTWSIVANVLYRELEAYDLKFELTDDPAKNCAVKLYDVQGGCYHSMMTDADSGEPLGPRVYISPGLTPISAEYVTFHEFAHHRQMIEGDGSREGMATRFVDDIECDADLRAVELRGEWVDGFQKQCIALGYTAEEVAVEELPGLRADHGLREKLN